MTYRSLRHCLEDLEQQGQLLRIEDEVDPHLEMAEIHRRVNEKKGPALLFTRVKGSPFPAASNIFGTLERSRYLFRHSLPLVAKLTKLKINPFEIVKHPSWLLSLMGTLSALPRKVSKGPILHSTTSLSKLPQIVSWPKDGGAFITLPQVYTEHPDSPGLKGSNLGMYRIQLSGGNYSLDKQVGMHYQIHRGIGIHHTAAARKGEKMKVSVFIGGPPAHCLSAVMPMPENRPELLFAGLLSGQRFPYILKDGYLLSALADFCITGTVDPKQTLPEGPFGDHLGYYSLAHPFPVLEVENVYHRKDAVFPFTVVGRPPQEDTVFGALIHEITGDLIPEELPGVKAVHAVDASGVHPLLLAIGQERYTPMGERKPMEILTQANAILGYGQCSLAKYLLIAADGDSANLDIHDIEKFFQHVLCRAYWKRDLHFQTTTTMDTLDYSGTGLNQGSKLVIAAAGPPIRQLGKEVPSALRLPEEFSKTKLALPGILVVSGPKYLDRKQGRKTQNELCEALLQPGLDGFPLVILCDDARFTARTLNNFLWVTFTRSDPAADISGAGEFMEDKHWGCTGSLVIDARMKPHHAPVLESDPAVVKMVESLAIIGGPLYGII